MTLRQRLANWISGGEISKLESKFGDLKDRLESVINRPGVVMAIQGAMVGDIQKSFTHTNSRPVTSPPMPTGGRPLREGGASRYHCCPGGGIHKFGRPAPLPASPDSGYQPIASMATYHPPKGGSGVKPQFEKAVSSTLPEKKDGPDAVTDSEIEHQNQIRVLESQIDDLEQIVQEEKRRADTAHKQYVEAQNKWVQVEELGRAGFRDRVVADFKKFSAEGQTVLWVQSSDPRAINQGTFAQISDIMKRVAPNIEAIFMTTGVTDLSTLKDEDLEKLGLRRLPTGNRDVMGGGVIGESDGR